MKKINTKNTIEELQPVISFAEKNCYEKMEIKATPKENGFIYEVVVSKWKDKPIAKIPYIGIHLDNIISNNLNFIKHIEKGENDYLVFQNEGEDDIKMFILHEHKAYGIQTFSKEEIDVLKQFIF